MPYTLRFGIGGNESRQSSLGLGIFLNEHSFLYESYMFSVVAPHD